MNILNIVTSPRKEKSASIAVVNAFLSEYRERVRDVTIDTLDIWQEQLPEFDAEAIDAKYKGVSGESMTPVETATCGCARQFLRGVRGPCCMPISCRAFKKAAAGLPATAYHFEGNWVRAC